MVWTRPGHRLESSPHPVTGACGCGAVVAHHLAKVRVASSNLVIRSSESFRVFRPGGVAERRGSGLQSRIHGFESRRHLTRCRKAHPIRSNSVRAIGAAVARFPDTEEVTGSIPVSPTRTPGPPGVFSFLRSGGRGRLGGLGIRGLRRLRGSRGLGFGLSGVVLGGLGDVHGRSLGSAAASRSGWNSGRRERRRRRSFCRNSVRNTMTATPSSGDRRDQTPAVTRASERSERRRSPAPRGPSWRGRHIGDRHVGRDMGSVGPGSTGRRSRREAAWWGRPSQNDRRVSSLQRDRSISTPTKYPGHSQGALSETGGRRAGIVERVSAQTGFDLFPDRAVVALRVNGELKDKATTVSKTDTVEPVEISSPDGLSILRHSTAHVMAQAVQKINPDAKLGIGPPVTDGFYYDFDVETPFTPEDLKAIEKEMDRIIRSGQRFERRVVTEEEARAELAERAVQARADRAQERRARRGQRRRRRIGRGRRRRAHDLRQRVEGRRDGLEGPLPRPARAEHRRAGRLQAHAHRRRLLAGLGEEPAAAAHLRHRVADEGRAARLHRAPRGGGEARPPQARPRARPVLVPRGDRLRPVGLAPARAAWSGMEMEQHARRRHIEAGLHLRLHAAHREGGPLPEVQPPRHLQGGDVPPDRDGRGARRRRQRHQAGRRLLPQAHELPDAHPDLRGARPQLPRSADAPRRERHRLPQRAVGRPARADPRARLHAGRRAPLRHPRSARGGDRPRCSTSSSRSCATSGSRSSSSSCRCATSTRTSGSARTSSGTTRPTRSATWRRPAG